MTQGCELEGHSNLNSQSKFYNLSHDTGLQFEVYMFTVVLRSVREGTGSKTKNIAEGHVVPILIMLYPQRGKGTYP